MKKAVNSNCKNPECRSDKLCACGCHNANNHKKNKNHNSTKVKLKRRILRKFLNEAIISEDEVCQFCFGTRRMHDSVAGVYKCPYC